MLKQLTVKQTLRQKIYSVNELLKNYSWTCAVSICHMEEGKTENKQRTVTDVTGVPVTAVTESVGNVKSLIHKMKSFILTHYRIITQFAPKQI